MNTRYLLTMFLLVCLTALAACSGSEPVAANQPSTEPQPKPPEPVAPAPPAEKFLVGQLQDVDLDAKTFVLKDLKGTEQEFAFSPATKVTGVATAQELRSQEGRNATIRYTEQDNLKSAVQIHVEIGS